MSRLIFFLMWLAQFLPYGVMSFLGKGVGFIAFRLIHERRIVTRINLEKCFPQMAPEARERLAHEHFAAFCRAFLDRAILWWSPRARVEKLVRIEGLEHIHALNGVPAILFAPHFVGLDAGFARLACEIDMVSMYANQKDPTFSTLLIKGRTRFGNQRLVSRQEGIRATLAAMRSGLPLYYLPDQDYGPRDALFVPFFGVPAATVPGLSRLARVAGAKVLPCVTELRPDGYVLRIEPPWDNFPGGDLAADTRRMNEFIERRIEGMPAQYFWMHKRFKTRPPGEAKFYPS